MVRALNKLDVTTKDIFLKSLVYKYNQHCCMHLKFGVCLNTDDDLEKVHTYACKRFLNVSIRTLDKEFRIW